MSTETITAYLQAWNATDPGERAALLDRVVTDDVRYVDPLADVTGRDALGGVIGAVQQQFPDMPLTLVSGPDAHHDVLRFSWGLGPAGQEPVVVGTDSVLLAEDGRFALVTGYLDKVPG
jgi:hypothetical protein